MGAPPTPPWMPPPPPRYYEPVPRAQSESQRGETLVSARGMPFPCQSWCGLLPADLLPAGTVSDTLLMSACAALPRPSQWSPAWGPLPMLCPRGTSS